MSNHKAGEMTAKTQAKLLTCGVCLERYRSPKLLPCFHTFCERCVQKVAGANPSFPCPTCRTVTVMPPGGAKELQVNFYLEKDLVKCDSETGKECEQCSQGKQAEFKCVGRIVRIRCRVGIPRDFVTPQEISNKARHFRNCTDSF